MKVNNLNSCANSLEDLTPEQMTHFMSLRNNFSEEILVNGDLFKIDFKHPGTIILTGTSQATCLLKVIIEEEPNRKIEIRTPSLNIEQRIRRIEKQIGILE